MRPPLEVYRLLQDTNSDGLDISYRINTGGVTTTVQADAGRSLPTLVNGSVAEAKGALGLTVTADCGAFSYRMGYEKATLTIASLNPLFDAFRQFGPEGIALADRYDANRKLLVLQTIGAGYHPGPWFVMGEWGRVETHSFQGRKTAWYASSGYRIGTFTPHLTFARARADNLSDPGLPLAGLPPAIARSAAGLNAALNTLLRSKSVQDTVSLGTRWDFAKSAALKLQVDRSRLGAGSASSLINLQPAYQPGGKLTLFSAALHFVY